MVSKIHFENFLFVLIFLPLGQSIILTQEDVRKLCREARIQENADKDVGTIVDGLTSVVESKLSTKAASNQTGEMDRLLVKSLVGNFLTRYGTSDFDAMSRPYRAAYRRNIKINQKISNEKDAVAGVTYLITEQNPTLKANDLIDRIASHDTVKDSEVSKTLMNMNIQSQAKRESGWEPLPIQMGRSTGKTKSSATSELIEKCANIRLPQEMDSTRAHKWWNNIDLIKEQLQE
ncbi:uncharacterized protein LOC141850877 [Brevipalpus obovatus]|uniref:uncharacterized protein LOC141850877 n=1 Tax=Brevipalpus obovatus TaxID=246614 RepID=UPI003D9F0447